MVTMGRVVLEGDLAVPSDAKGIVLFAHGSGSSRLSPRSRRVATAIHSSGTATLLFDLLTPREEQRDAEDGRLRFDIELLTRRLVGATEWVGVRADTKHLGIGYFGASTGAAAALAAAVQLGSGVMAVVSRGGRPDLIGVGLAGVVAPTLLIVGGRDDYVLELNEEAYVNLRCKKRIVVVPGATHLFEEPGAMAQVASLADSWFREHLRLR